MNSTTIKTSPRIAVSEIAKTSLVAALYVTVTMVLSVISFGIIQLRLSEMFNYLALYHKRYVVAVTAGVVIANFMSPTWILDVPIGGIATLLVLLICRRATRNIESNVWKIGITAVIFTMSMFTVAAQLTIMLKVPFWPTYGMVALGEFTSMVIGGIVIHALQKKIDFTI